MSIRKGGLCQFRNADVFKKNHCWVYKLGIGVLPSADMERTIVKL